MPETNLALFHRTKWFRLDPDTSAPEMPAGGLLPGRTFSVAQPSHESGVVAPGANPADDHEFRIDWIRMVAFEWPDQRGKLKDDRQANNCAQNAVLLFRVSTIRGLPYERLLLLNEFFRYYTQPYATHDAALTNAGLTSLPGREGTVSDGPLHYRRPFSTLLCAPLELKRSDKSGSLSLVPDAWIANADHAALVIPRGSQQKSNAPQLPRWSEIAEHQAPKRREKTWGGRYHDWPNSWDVYPDNRMFVWTCAVLEGSGREGSKAFPLPKDGEQNSELYRRWFALLNVDSEVPETLDDFSIQWLMDRTYLRWASGGTVYGFNNFSVAMLGISPYPNVPWHFESIYLDMGLLMLQLRTSLFRFSRLVTQVTHDRTVLSISDSEFMKRFAALRESFAHFTNLYHFPLLSTQQQGIEMYQILRKNMDVDDLYKEIQTELNESHSVMQSIAEVRLDRVLAWFVPATLAISAAALAFEFFQVGTSLRSAVLLAVIFAGIASVFAALVLKRVARL